MCGIAGILNIKRLSVDPAMLRRMTDCMAHRGPDSDGFFVENEIALGFRRLAIIDLSTVANQPLYDPSGRYVLIFNGEMYNFREVKAELKDYPFVSQGDSEVILAAYAKWGPACIEKFAGMFALAIWDKHKRELFVARDRMGVKPVYYYAGQEHFIFASEIRSILKTGLVSASINPQAIDDFLSFQSVGFPHSIIKNIQQLEAGCWLRISESGVEVHKYWDITKSSTNFDFSSKEAVKKQVYALLQQSVQRRLISDVPLGAFLSGGIDSSAVVGLMAATSSEPVNTFNIAFNEPEYDESSYAQQIAKRFNTRHTEMRLEPTVFLDELQNALNSMDTPSGDGVNTYVVSKKIRQSGLTVALSGVGGDELFAGYPFFPQYYRLNKWKKSWALSSPFRKLAANFIKANGSVRNDRIKQLLKLDELDIAGFYPLARQIFSPRQIGKLTNHQVMQESLVQEQLRRNAGAIKKFPVLSQVSIAEYLGYTQHTLLKDTDQMSMAVSLEVREPYFDHDLVEFVLNIPDEYKFPTYPKSLLVESLGTLLPPEIVHRKKQGFVFPWKVWMKNELRSFCEAQIKKLAQKDFISGDYVNKLWQRFISGDESVRWMEIWLLLILEYWMDKNHVN